MKSKKSLCFSNSVFQLKLHSCIFSRKIAYPALPWGTWIKETLLGIERAEANYSARLDMKPQPQGCEACILRLCKNHCNRSSGCFIIFATGPDLTHNVTVCEPMRLLYGGQLTPHTQSDCFIASYCFDITLVSRSYSFDRLVSKCFVVAAASVCLFICLSVCLFICSPVCLFICLTVCLFIGSPVCLFIC